jgi:hypothetical protein
MRNFYTTSPDDKVFDENGNAVYDENGDPVYSEGAVLANVWEEEQITAGIFVELEFTTVMRFSSFDIDLYHGGNKYIATELSIDNLSFTSDLSVDTATVRLPNVNLTMSAVLLNNDEIGSMATISIGAVAASRRLYDLEPIIVGELTGWGVNERVAELNYSGLMARWSKKTLRIAQASCPWPLGGDECQYAGSETCNQTFARCKALGNQLNFGGFPWLPDLMEKKIYWGFYPPSS